MLPEGRHEEAYALGPCLWLLSDLVNRHHPLILFLGQELVVPPIHPPSTHLGVLRLDPFLLVPVVQGHAEQEAQFVNANVLKGCWGAVLGVCLDAHSHMRFNHADEGMLAVHRVVQVEGVGLGSRREPV